MSVGRGATFAEGWYLKLTNHDIPLDQKTFAKLDEDFHWTFVPKDLEDQAHQEVYSLSMEQFKGDFDQYTSAFRLAQACSRIDLDSILVDTLQQGVSNQLAIMMTAAALPLGQEKTGWRWEQWLDKAGELYRNVIWLWEIKRRDDNLMEFSIEMDSLLEEETNPWSGRNGHWLDKSLPLWKKTLYEGK